MYVIVHTDKKNPPVIYNVLIYYINIYIYKKSRLKTINPLREIWPPYQGKATAAARAALPSPTIVQMHAGSFLCFHNPSNFGMDERITCSFLWLHNTINSKYPVRLYVCWVFFCVSVIYQTLSLTWTTGSVTCVCDHSYACIILIVNTHGTPTVSQHYIFTRKNSLSFSCAPGQIWTRVRDCE